MVDYNKIKMSVAEDVDSMLAPNKYFTWTSTAINNQKVLYDELHTWLLSLEISLRVNQKELEEIKQKAKHLFIPKEEKEDIQRRLDWLNRLYEVKSELANVKTIEQAEILKRALLPVQTCPMKKELLSQLDTWLTHWQTDAENVDEISTFDQLMEHAIEKAGEEFINLGKTGREFVIQHVLEEYGKDADTHHVREETTALNEQVRTLANIIDREELVTSLETLPLTTYAGLSQDRKEAIAIQLLSRPSWDGQAELDRLVKQLNQALDRRESEQKIDDVLLLENGSKVAFTVNLNPINNQDKVLKFSPSSL